MKILDSACIVNYKFVFLAFFFSVRGCKVLAKFPFSDRHILRIFKWSNVMHICVTV